VGANAGVYALSAAKLVSPGGCVIAFEPSPRERSRLEAHLRLNGVANVTVEPAAIGDVDADVDLFVVEGVQTGCNSLRPPHAGRTSTIQVPMWRLDGYLARHGVGRVDFVKMDVEGGERDALRGAEQLFRRDRPVLLCEVEATRIRPWGYEPREIFELVAEWNYRWFAIARSGELVPAGADPPPGNYVARPG
jgi:FkbM family methyltransferase